MMIFLFHKDFYSFVNNCALKKMFKHSNYVNQIPLTLILNIHLVGKCVMYIFINFNNANFEYIEFWLNGEVGYTYFYKF